LIKRSHFFNKKDTVDYIDFRTLISEYSDEKLITALKQRTYYIPEAEKFLVEEAIRREIIFSEQDLLADEYRVEELHFSFFPSIKDNKIRDRIRKSIARSSVIAGIIPVVFGLLELNKGESVEGSLILFFGLFWIFSSSQLVKAFQKIYVWLLLAASVLSLGYIVVRFILTKDPVFMDVFIPFIVFGFIIYGMIFLTKMYKH